MRRRLAGVTEVALRKESVDRNRQLHPPKCGGLPSLSARRAWIETSAARAAWPCSAVALRKESVDRNMSIGVSLKPSGVALRKESVDRNV